MIDKIKELKEKLSTTKDVNVKKAIELKLKMLKDNKTITK